MHGGTGEWQARESFQASKPLQKGPRLCILFKGIGVSGSFQAAVHFPRLRKSLAIALRNSGDPHQRWNWAWQREAVAIQKMLASEAVIGHYWRKKALIPLTTLLHARA